MVSTRPATIGQVLGSFAAIWRIRLVEWFRGQTALGLLLDRLVKPVLVVGVLVMIYSMLARSPGFSSRFESAAGTSDYVSYLVLGMVAMSFLRASLWEMGYSIRSEQTKGTLELLFLTPGSRTSWLVAGTSASYLLTFLDFAYLLAVSKLVFGISLGAGLSPAWVVAAVAASGLSFYGFGFVMAGIGLVTRQVDYVSEILNSAFLFLSGVAFPVAFLPQGLRCLAGLFPTTYAVRLLRSAFLGVGSTSQMISDLTILVLSGTVTCFLGYLVMKRMESQVKGSGTLQLY